MKINDGWFFAQPRSSDSIPIQLTPDVLSKDWLTITAKVQDPAREETTWIEWEVVDTQYRENEDTPYVGPTVTFSWINTSTEGTAIDYRIEIRPSEA